MEADGVKRDEKTGRDEVTRTSRRAGDHWWGHHYCGQEGRAGQEAKEGKQGEREVMSCFVKCLMGEINTILCKDLSPVKAGLEEW